MNVLLVLGHPRKDSLCGALCAAYQEGDRRNAASGPFTGGWPAGYCKVGRRPPTRASVAS